MATLADCAPQHAHSAHQPLAGHGLLAWVSMSSECPELHSFPTARSTITRIDQNTERK